MIRLIKLLNESKKESAETLLDKFAKQYKVSSFYFQINKKGEAVFEYSKDAKSNDVFGIGSVSKGIDKIAIMKLVEQGKLKLSDKILQFGFDVPKDGINLVNYYDWDGWDTITVEHLMLHKSGIADIINDIPEFNIHYGEHGKEKDPDELMILRAVAKYPLKFKPGSSESYSNTNFWLLAKIIEHVTKKSYGDAIKDLIFSPVGMKQTTWAYESTQPKNLVKGRVLDQTSDKLLPAFKIKPFDAYAIFYSTPEDMMKLGEAYINDEIISKKTREQFFNDSDNSPGQLGAIHDGYICRWDAYIDSKTTFIFVINVFGQTVIDPLMKVAAEVRDLFM